ncbi:MAG TPA: FAD-linked oxidase C-terminal domain-containing protein [Chloroflexia bacterium]|jgi:D-lactate dehydrogenase (cytochrome)|nr:FAD-linked oxidase C-terminal domain-containing protein [Chloroflexia bacterium]
MTEALAELQAQLGPDKVTTSPTVLQSHGRDENFPEVRPPLAVAYAEQLEDVQTVVHWCGAHQVALIPFGAGTSLEGALVPSDPQVPTISLDLSRMNQVLSIQPENFLAVVQPGVTRTALNTALRYTGLFFPVDPGADASLGGMAATNASGTTTVRYGGMRPNTLALQVVLANGEVLRLGRPVFKTSSGYDLKDLFIGSSGTLGVITELTVRLHPLPEHIHTLRVFFPSITAAAEAAYAVMTSALPVARLELVDELSMRSINRYLGRSYQEAPGLFLEFHSATAAAMETEVALVEGLMRDAGATDLAVARTPEERTAQWEARHHVYWALVNMHPGQVYMITDTAVPLAHLPESIAHAQELLGAMGLHGSILGHVGDGNFHTLVAVAPADYERAHAFGEQLVHHALALGGTASGEHGIGLVKRGYMAEEHGAALDWMRRVKALFDPQGLLNPGKII